MVLSIERVLPDQVVQYCAKTSNICLNYDKNTAKNDSKMGSSRGGSGKLHTPFPISEVLWQNMTCIPSTQRLSVVPRAMRS